MQVGVTIKKNANLQPVTEEQLRHSVYEMLSVLEILYNSAHGRGEADTSCGVIDFLGEPEQIKLLEKSMMWEYLHPMYLFAELGEPLDVIDYHLSDMLGDLAKWITAANPILEYDGTPLNQAVSKVIYKFIARLKLNYRWDFEGNYGPEDNPDPLPHSDAKNGINPLCFGPSISHGWYPDTHKRYLTLVELALLAGMSNIRSVRNAQFSKSDPLSFIKEGAQVLITVEEARRWLQGRNGFIPTKGIEY